MSAQGRIGDSQVPGGMRGAALSGLRGRVATTAICVAAAVLVAAPGLEAQSSLDVTPGTSPVTEGGSVTFEITLASPLTANDQLNFVLAVTEDDPTDMLNQPTFKSASHFVDAGANVVFEPMPFTNFLSPATTTRAVTSGISRYTLTIATTDDGTSEAPELIAVMAAVLVSDNSVFFAGQPPLVCVLDNDGGSQACPGGGEPPPPPPLSEITVRTALSAGVADEGANLIYRLERTAPGEILELPVNVRVDATPGNLVTSGDGGARVVTFERSRISATLDVRTVSDALDGSDGRVTVTVVSGADYEVGSPGSASYDVRDVRDDAPPDGGGGGGGDDDGDGDGDGDDGGGDDVGGDDGGGDDGDASFRLDRAECGAELCVTRTGVRVVATATSGGVSDERLWRTSDGQTGPGIGRRFRPTWTEPGYYTISLTVKTAGGVEKTNTRRVLVRPSDPAGTCEPGAERLCFLHERFAVEVEWTDPDGETSLARNVYEGTNDAGLFWFADRSNWEILVKVLDGCGSNGHHWVYSASTTDLEYALRVTDTKMDVMKEYRNEAGTAAPAVTDATAFPDSCGR